LNRLPMGYTSLIAFIEPGCVIDLEGSAANGYMVGFRLKCTALFCGQCSSWQSEEKDKND
jgi:hypothetical protein